MTTAPAIFSDTSPSQDTDVASGGADSKNNNTASTDSLADDSEPHHSANRYICIFHILNCHSTFADAREWKAHVLGHFRAHTPPSTARCPLCPDERFVDDLSPNPDNTHAHSYTHTAPNAKAWDRMLDHVDIAHYRHGQTLAGSRPDFELMHYLYRMRIIGVEEFKVLQLPPAPTSPAYHSSQDSVRRSIGSADEPFWAPYSRRREERLRGAGSGGGGGLWDDGDGGGFV
jgi:hypothetical protein